MSRENRDVRDEVAEGLRAVREEARLSPAPPAPTPGAVSTTSLSPPLSPLDAPAPQEPAASPDREALNRAWDVAEPAGRAGFVSSTLRRLGRLLLGSMVDRQVRMNSLQVTFDNEVVRYIDERVDRVSRHYDHVLGLHGKRMEEIDERHRILQQELVRHVHELVERIDFVFESTEQNHLYLEGMLRELREELVKISERLAELRPEKR